MRYLHRSTLCILGVPALIAVSFYVLFDLLDIDGSNFFQGGSAYIYEEKVAEDEGHNGKDAFPVRPIPSKLQPPSTHLSPAGLTLSSSSRRPPCRIVPWRRATACESASRPERGEPPVPPA